MERGDFCSPPTPEPRLWKNWRIDLQNYKLLLAYDGSRYAGWQRLARTEQTVQGKVETALSRLTGQAVQICGSGRTDAGVHAEGQVASFRLETAVDCGVLLEQLRRYLPEDIGALALEPAPERFHARLSARRKTYRYRIWNSSLPCVFERKYVYPVPQPLDAGLMEQEARQLLGTHDFAAFCTRRSEKKSTVRTLEQVRVEQTGQELRLYYTADGFLYNMARILTGTLIEIGDGRRPPQTMGVVLESRRRELAGYTAPAKGLCLMEVEY